MRIYAYIKSDAYSILYKRKVGNIENTNISTIEIFREMISLNLKKTIDEATQIE